MIKTYTAFKLGAIVLVVLLLSNCVATQSFPTIARSGDTITLAVGSPANMTKSNTSAQFYYDTDTSKTNPIALNLRSAVRLRPDPTSELATYRESYFAAQPYATGHSQWLAVLVLDLPLGMTGGKGEVVVTTLASYGALPSVTDSPIALEIIPGIGESSTFNYFGFGGGEASGDLPLLEPMTQVTVRPPAGINHSGPNPDIAAAEIKVTIPMETSSGGAVSDGEIRVVGDDRYRNNPQDQMQMSWSRSGDEFTVNFISPIGTMRYSQASFSVVIPRADIFTDTPGPGVVSVQYFDIYGNVVAAMPAVSDFTAVIEQY